MFEEKLNRLIDEFVAGPDTREQAITALELALMHLKEDGDGEDEC